VAFSSASDMWLPVQSVASGSEETSSLAPEGTLKDREPRRGITFFLIPPACRYVLMLLGVWVLLHLWRREKGRRPTGLRGYS